MYKLLDYGFTNRCDTFDTYYKEIKENLELCIFKHIKDKNWSCSLIQNIHEYNLNDEITISYDCTFEWVMDLEKILTKEKL